VLRWFSVILPPLLLLPSGWAHAQGDCPGSRVSENGTAPLDTKTGTVPATAHEVPEPLPPIGADWLRWPPEDAVVEPLPPIEMPLQAGEGSSRVGGMTFTPSKEIGPAAPGDKARAKIWDGSFELGLNGAEGNTENMNFRFGFKTKRETLTSKLTFNVDYRKASQNTLDTADRLYSDWRAERLFPGSRWTYFANGSVEYDEFQAFDSRVTSGLGVGYALIKQETTKLVARCGAGVAREFGVPDAEYVPEAVFGSDLEWRVGKRYKLTFMAEYTPDITAFGEYRLKSQAAWEMLFDQETNLSLKFSVLERYNSLPRGKRPNDVDYAATILWKF
jgi:putative salt-induced outer membrane protein YdiY